MKYPHISSRLTNNSFDKSQPFSDGFSTNTPEIKTLQHDTLDHTNPNEKITPRGQKSKTSTPFSSSQRELKKIKDYWTRNNPVHEDSPRLRSNGKIISDVKECFGEGQRVNRSKNCENKTQENNTNEEGYLPESPIPSYSRNQYEKDITSQKDTLQHKNEIENNLTDDNTKTNYTANSGSPNISTKLHIRYPDVQQSNSQGTKTERNTRNSPVHQCNTNQTETVSNVPIPDMSMLKSFAESSRFCDPSSNMSENLDLSDSGDPYFIIPRKKRRSEVAKDELWDGIPLTVSFKRLASMSKQNFESPLNVPHNTHTEAKVYEENEEKHHYEIYNVANEASPTTELPTVSANNVYTNRALTVAYENKGNYNNIKYVTNNKATPMSIKRKSTRAIAETKQSGRLIEKSSESPTKKELKYYSVTEDSAYSTYSLHNSTELNIQNESFTLKETLTITDLNAIASLTDGFETSLEELRDLTADGQSNDNLHPRTMSNILSYDSKNDVFGAKENDMLVLKQCGTDIDRESPVTIATSSISNTLNSLFDGHGEHTLIRQRHLNDMNDDDVRVIQNNSITMRKSERLLKIETRKSNQNSPDMPYIDNNETMTGASETESNTSTEEKDSKNIKDTEDIQTVAAVSAFSKHKLFSSNTKIPKLVPPLRIKLKQPVKNARKKTSQAKTKQKTKSVDDNKSPKASILKHKINVSDSEVKTSKDVKEEKASSADRKQSSISRSPTGTKQRNRSSKTRLTPKTPKEKKPKKRKWSPPSSDTVSLRLSNERRLSAKDELLSNLVLNRHACVLWSSENRRQVQLSNPSVARNELDAILSRKWDGLSDKEKMRYFQRARNAIKDENRHSIRRGDVLKENHCVEDAGKRVTVDSFVKMTSVCQMMEIKKWLTFYHEVSPELCTQVIQSFKSSLMEENRQRTKRVGELKKSRSKSRENKQKKKEEQQYTTDNNSSHRNILFSKIIDNRERIRELLTEKKTQRQIMHEYYSNILRSIVSGQVVYFGGDSKSDKLTETLHDLMVLEKDSKLSVLGDVLNDKDFEDIFGRLGFQSSPDGNNLVCTLEHASVLEHSSALEHFTALEQFSIDDSDIEDRCKEITSVAQLSPRTLSIYLPEVFVSESENEINILSPRKLGHGSRTSPVAILTDWVSEDLLALQPKIGVNDDHIALQPKIGFRNAISLLSNKVVPSPTLIMPTNTAHGNKSTANRNQNCNVVFTNIRKARPLH